MLIHAISTSTVTPTSSFDCGRPSIARLNSASSHGSNGSQDSQSSRIHRNFGHYREPSVLDQPGAIMAMKEALQRNDTYALAYLVRHYGLPSNLRAKAWPVLLKAHPYVLKARSEQPQVEYALDAKTTRHLKGDIGRMARFRGECFESELTSSVVTTFLHKWGSKITFETPMVWVADFLIGGSIHWSSSASPSPGSSMASSPMESSSILSAATARSEVSSLPSVRSSVSAHEYSETESEVSAASSTSSIPTSSFGGLERTQVHEAFENVMLIMAYSPPGFSEFIAIIRTVIPDLGEHFAFEGILTGASSGDVWLVWWLRWMGIRAFPAVVLERFWDEYFAFREDDDDRSEVASEERTLTNVGQPLVVDGEEQECAKLLAAPSVIGTHIFNCAVLMRENKQRLLELDQSECRQFLAHMPPCKDMEAVVAEAHALAERVIELKP